MQIIPRLALAMALIATANLSAAEEKPKDLPVFAPKVKSVAAFKNGLAFVFKTAETPLKEGWARMAQLPPASLGSLWIGTTSKSGGVTDIIAYKEKVPVEADSMTLGELLAANAGRHVNITYVTGSSVKTAEGTLLPAPVPRKADEDDLGPTDQRLPVNPWARAEPATGDMVLLRGDKSSSGDAVLLALNLSSIQAVEISGKASLRSKTDRDMARTKIHLAGKPSHAEITLACLEKGITWSPSYRINIADDKNAAIEMDAVLADDQEDLDNADVAFVVGYPNFLFADMISPMSLRQSVGEFLQGLMNGGNERGRAGMFANSMSQSIAFNNPPNEGGAPGAGYSALTVPPQDQNEDLYLYRKSGVTLKKGDRASFNILAETVPYEHIHQWEVGDSMNVDEQGDRSGGRPKTEDLVWHMLRLTNTGQKPWTTGPAFAVNGDLPVAQDTLTYTPPGALSTLKLTVSTDTRALQSQTETSRQPVKISGRSYEAVIVEGKLKLTNFKNKEISMVVRKTLVGQVLESPGGTATKVGENIEAVNPTSRIVWEFKLAAGQEKELTYNYKVLLNR